MEQETIAVRGEDEGDVEGLRVLESLLDSVPNTVPVILRFNKRKADVRFGVEDVVGFDGPDGPIVVNAVNVVPNSQDQEFDISFATQSSLGTYTIVIGTDISDPEGNLLNQDGDDTNGDVVYLVGANVLSMERSNQFRPHEFRLWIALHECAHRLQFVGVPWLRDYFLELVGELVASAVPEPGRWARVMADVRRANEDGEPLIGETGLFGLFATSSQKDLLERVQALMSLLEGHGHVVMDRIGRRELSSQQRMAAVLKQRRKDPRTATFLRISGLEMKMRQYEQGERFVLAVEREAGWEALDSAWEGPGSLPTLAEINDPGQWLRRIGP